jgi:hypothetical protein
MLSADAFWSEYSNPETHNKPSYQQILNRLVVRRAEKAAQDAADAREFFGGNHDSLRYWCPQYRKFPGFFISQPATNSTTTNTLNSHQVIIIFTLLFLCDGAHIVASIPTD